MMVELNRTWISTVPAFAKIIARDKKSPGDYRGEKKLRAKQEFTYIYHMVDFSSPLEFFPLETRKSSALRYAGLKEEDVTSDKVLDEAMNEYRHIQENSAVSMRMYRASQKSLDDLADHVSSINFAAVDRQGRLLYSPKDHVQMLAIADKGLEALAKMKLRVQEELKMGNDIRGNRDKGITEDPGNISEVWNEDPNDDSLPKRGNTNDARDYDGSSVMDLIDNPSLDRYMKL